MLYNKNSKEIPITAIGFYGYGNTTKNDITDIEIQESTYFGVPCVSFDTNNDLKAENVMELYKSMQQEGEEKGYVPFIIYDEGRNIETVEWEIEKYKSYEAMAAHYLVSYKSISAEQFFSDIKRSMKRIICLILAG